MKEITPIAYFHSPLTSKFGIPRQSGLSENLIGHIVFEKRYRKKEALRGLDEFDYLWLIWGFSANKSLNECKLTVRPPRLGGNERLGVFATRSPFRPNGLGLSCVRIKQISEENIEVVGADLMDGTPIYDIKPYLPYADCHTDALSGYTEFTNEHSLYVEADSLELSKVSGDKREALMKVLSLDPRPSYQNSDESRVYGLRFASYEVNFKVTGDKLRILKITTIVE